MIINNNVSNYRLNPKNLIQKLLLPTLIASTSLNAFGEVTLEDSSGWKFGVNGHIPVFALVSDNEDTDEDAFRITTGFNPATAQFNIYAPKQNGLDVSGHIQLNSHLAGADGVQNSGDLESRVAEIAISGDFGSVNIGKGFGIFGVPGIGDNGSGLGVGKFSPNGGAATAGRIGNGYFYANFNPRVMYTSAGTSGTQFKIGLFQPEKPDGDPVAMTESPRVEGNVVWSGDMLSLWSSAFIQEVDIDSDTIDSFTMFGVDFGGSYTAGDISFRANYSLTQGTGNGVFGGHGVAGGAEEEEATQWYIEGTYNINKMKLGASYGQGDDDLDENETDLTMLFLRYKTTDALTILVELQTFSDEQNNDYNAVIVGSQFTF